MIAGQRPAQRATTLLELLLCMGLLGLLMTGMFALLVANNRYMRNSTARLETQQQAISSLTRLTRELTEGNRYAISVESNALVFASPRDLEGRVRFDSRGRLLWHKYICYYIDPDYEGVPCLLRKVVPLASPSHDVPPAPQVAAVRDDNRLRPRVMARHVDTLAPELTAAGPVALNVIARYKQHGKVYGLEIKSKVYMRN